MFGDQTKTYLLYNRGLMPNDLTLGSLHMDPANPIDDENKYFQYYEPVDSQWLRTIQIDMPCSVSVHASREWLAQAGLLNVFTGESGSSRSADVTVSGKRGRRLQLKNPEAFLNNVVLPSHSARCWLERMLTVPSRMAALSKLRRTFCKPPKVWMITGIQYIEDATINNAASSTHSTAATVSIPPPDPTLVAAMANIPSISSGLSVNHNHGTNTEYGHTDERVWAAQFRSLQVEYTTFRDQVDPSTNGDPTWIALKASQNMGRQGIRVEFGNEEVHETPDIMPMFAKVVGVDGDSAEEDQEQSPKSVLDTMLDVDWVLADDAIYEALE